MCSFQSEQVIKLRNTPVLLEKKRMATEIGRSQIHWIIIGYTGGDAGTLLKYTPNRLTLLRAKEGLFCYRYGIICHMSSLIRQSCHVEWDFNRVLLQLVDILNTA